MELTAEQRRALALETSRYMVLVGYLILGISLIFAFLFALAALAALLNGEKPLNSASVAFSLLVIIAAIYFVRAVATINYYAPVKRMLEREPVSGGGMKE